jgi:hypothetical protein
MRDVGSQLAGYFEVATERIDAADVFAQADVRRQAAAPKRRRWRPSWAIAAGFAGALVLIGGGFLAGWLLNEPDTHVTTPAGAGAERGGGWGWWPILIVAAVVLAVLGTLVVRRLRDTTKETIMQTQEKTHLDLSDTRATRRRRRWIILAAVLAIVVAGAGFWAIVAANQTDDIDIATDLVDDWIAAINASDLEAYLAVFSEDVRDDMRVAEWPRASEMSNAIRTGDLVATDDPRTFSFPAQFDWRGGTWVSEGEIVLQDDLARLIRSAGEHTQIFE